MAENFEIRVRVLELKRSKKVYNLELNRANQHEIFGAFNFWNFPN